MATSLTFTDTVFVSSSQFVSASQLIEQPIVSAGPNGSRIYGIAGYTNATSSLQVQILYSSSTSMPMYTTLVPANSGLTSSIAAFDLFGATVGASIFQKQKDANGAPYFNLPAGTQLMAIVSGSVAQRLYTTAVLNITTFGENY
jgi:hypothetical protein